MIKYQNSILKKDNPILRHNGNQACVEIIKDTYDKPRNTNIISKCDEGKCICLYCGNLFKDNGEKSFCSDTCKNSFIMYKGYIPKLHKRIV